MPEENLVEIILYVNNDEPIKVNKDPLLANRGGPEPLFDSTLKGVFTEAFSIIAPTIVIAYNKVPNFNYVHIPSLKRYYYVSDVVSVATNMWEISLTVDVLMSYSLSINNFHGIIERNEFQYYPLVIDNMQPFLQGYDVETYEGLSYVGGGGETGPGHKNFVISGCLLWEEEIDE